MTLETLGKSTAKFSKLELFDKPQEVTKVTMVSDEVTAVCPVTGQPDWYTVYIEYRPHHHCIESKTLKLYLQSFREKGLFCEAFAAQIATDIAKAAHPHEVNVKVIQAPRGGVSIEACATR